MKKFTDTLSPPGWIVLALSGYVGIVLFFRPTLGEMLLFFAVDTLALIPTALIERPVFSKMYPASRLYFPELDVERIARLDNEGKRELLESLMQFPARRARYASIGSGLKIIPAVAVGIFAWHHAVSPVFQFLQFVACETLILSIYYGMCYIELHIFVSKAIAELHAKHDFTYAFETADLGHQAPDFLREEKLSLIAAACGIVALLVMATSTAPLKTTTQLVYEVLTVFGIAMVCLGYIYYLNRRYIIGSLRNLSEMFASIDFGRNDFIVPFDSSPTLAQFERTFNTLLARLRHRERELGQWMSHEMEQSRFRALGEISGLVVHDLASPLHVVKFCASELAEKPELKDHENYLRMLSLNTNRALDLVDSLKAYLKDPKARSGVASLSETFRYVTQILCTQFRKDGVERGVRFELAPEAALLELALPRGDLIQILENLFRNSIENLLDHRHTDGLISLHLHAEDELTVVLKLIDNGSGLSATQFERLTTPELSNFGAGEFYKGLGLRLTRGLIERHLGQLRVVDSEARSGTTFLLTLRKAPPVAQETGCSPSP
ncbi:MAG: HAMP domain-containing histidine kinase [Deltaproteobacteria bacterium]|nr:HAMP domain-containing histidine kinase [Deltaproteobacteria bacterium]